MPPKMIKSKSGCSLVLTFSLLLHMSSGNTPAWMALSCAAWRWNASTAARSLDANGAACLRSSAALAATMNRRAWRRRAGGTSAAGCARAGRGGGKARDVAAVVLVLPTLLRLLTLWSESDIESRLLRRLAAGLSEGKAIPRIANASSADVTGGRQKLLTSPPSAPAAALAAWSPTRAHSDSPKASADSAAESSAPKLGGSSEMAERSTCTEAKVASVATTPALHSSAGPEPSPPLFWRRSHRSDPAGGSGAISSSSGLAGRASGSAGSGRRLAGDSGAVADAALPPSALATTPSPTTAAVWCRGSCCCCCCRGRHCGGGHA